MNNTYFSKIGKYLSQLQTIDQLFQTWNYYPTIVPLIEPYDAYTDLLNEKEEEYFRVLDSNRNVQLIRADSTIFLARIISKHITQDMLPLRVCYSNSVLRLTKEYNDTEMWQSGIELFGVPGIAGDFEIVLLIHHALQHIVPDEYTIHIGSRHIVEQCLRSNIPHISDKDIKKVFRAFLQRDYATIISYTNQDFANLMLSIMETEEFAAQKHRIATYLPPESPALREYDTFLKALAQVIDPSRIRCDFSEIGTHDYYSNIVFSVYVKDKPSPAAQGGRYDSLMHYFNAHVAAVGATIFSHVLTDFLIQQNTHTTHGIEHGHENAFNTLVNIESPSVEDLVRSAHIQQGIRL